MTCRVVYATPFESNETELSNRIVQLWNTTSFDRNAKMMRHVVENIAKPNRVFQETIQWKERVVSNERTRKTRETDGWPISEEIKEHERNLDATLRI